MLIKRILLKNFRQYRNLEISFSDDKRIFLFVGKNGTGKSNFLNAINWCLYDDEPFRTGLQGLPIWHKECKPGDIVEVEIEIGSKDEIATWIFQRILHVGTKGSILNVFEKRGMTAEPRILPNPNEHVGRYLPKEVRNFFLFDGEQIANIFVSKYGDSIKEGINRVAQVDLLDRTIDHMEKIESEYRMDASKDLPELQKDNDKIDLKKGRIRILDKAINENKKRISDLKEQREEMKEQQKQVEAARILRIECDNLEKNSASLFENIENIKDQINDLIYESGPLIYMADELCDVSGLLDQERERGLIPPSIRSKLINELIEIKRCICGRHLEKNSPEYQELKSLLIKIDKADKKSIFMEGSYILNGLLQNKLAIFEQEMRQCKTNYQEKKKSYESTQQALKEKSEMLKRLGEGVGDIERTINDITGQIESLQKDLGSKEKEKEGLNIQLKISEDVVEKLLKTKERNKKAKNCYEETRQIKGVLEEIKEKVSQRIHDIILSEANSNFRKLGWKDDLVQIKINDAFEIEVLDKKHVNIFGSLSTGERKILGLALLGALSSISGFNASIFIDNPLGMLDEEVKSNVAASLPKFLPEKQIIIFSLDSYLTKDIERELNKDKTVFKYNLEYSKGITTIKED
ncbi:MAG: AAA family ATPase [Candidatus Omnitrophica bacterium]|nr:AAA family ATPase [Candidatus Omnitrophota bacterium]